MNKNGDDIQDLSQEIEQKQLILYDHPHNVKARHIKAQLKTLEDKVSETPPVELGKNTKKFDKLVDDLVTFVKTGKGPSNLLDAEMKKDKSLYTQLARKVKESNKLGDIELYPVSPLEHSLRNIHNYPDVFKYLLTHGADHGYNQVDQDILHKVLTREHEILLEATPFLIDAHYFARTGELTKVIYRQPSIAFREKFDKIIWKNADYQFKCMNKQIFIQACYTNDLRMVEYCYQQGVNITLQEKGEIYYKVCLSGLLEMIKLLLHYKEFQPLFEEMLITAVEYDQVQIADYLINYCKSEGISLDSFYSRIRIEPKHVITFARIYCRYLNPNLNVNRSVLEKEIAEFQKDQSKKMEETLETAMSYYKNKKESFTMRTSRFGMKLMRLALTYKPVKEQKAGILELTSRLTAISDLPIIDPFAVEYAIHQVKNLVQKDTKPVEILDPLAKAYYQYIKNIAHIEISAQEHLHFLLSWTNIDRHREQSKHLLDIQEASEADLILCPPQNSDEIPLLPRILSGLVMAYLIRTPSLIHIFHALKSEEKEKCLNCGTELSTKPEITFLGNRKKKDTSVKPVTADTALSLKFSQT